MNRQSSPVSHLAPATVTARASRPGRHGIPAAFGRRFFVGLLLGLVWIGPAWLDLRFLYGMAAWDLLMLLAWFNDWRRLPPPESLEVARRWEGALSQGAQTQVALSVRQTGRAPLRVRLQDDVPWSLGFGSTAAVPQVELEVPPSGSASATYTLQPVERGDAEVGRVFLQYQSTLQLAERWAVAGLPQTIRVYPNLQESKRHILYLIRSRQIELEKRLKRQRGVGREFESLRDYREGDEPRDICWTATARRAKLISKTYQVERSQSVLMVLDAGRLMLARVEPIGDSGLPISVSGHLAEPNTESKIQNLKSKIGLTKLDAAVTAALSLAQVALYSGDAVGLLAYGRRRQSRLNVARGKAHLRALLEQLALVRGELLEADHGRAADALLARERRRSLVVWLTDLAETAATPEVIESASRLLRQHLLLLVVIGQPQLALLAARKPESATEMYRYVAAQEMIARRELLLRRLRSQGALALELAPGQLASGLVNQYLEIKERSLL